MSPPQFKIKMDIPLVSLVDLSEIKELMFRRAGKPAFIIGEEFDVVYTITNIGDAPFPGGTLAIDIRWPNGQMETTSYQIDQLNPGEQDHLRSRWGILAPGFALFFAYLIVPGQKKITGVDTVPLFRDERNEIKYNVSFFSIFAQTAEEFYQFWAMIFAVFSILIIVIGGYIIPFIKWISSIL